MEGARLELGSGHGYDAIGVVGELDLHSQEPLRVLARAESFQERVLVIDLSQVTFLDSAGIGCLVSAMRTTGARGSELVLITQGTHILKLLRMAGLHHLLRIYPSMAQFTEAEAS